MGQRGPSILELARAADLTVRRSSTLFALGAGGYLMGCLASGVTFGRFHKLMSLFWSAIGLGATTIVLPLCSSYEVLAALYCFNFVFVGWLESGTHWHLPSLSPPQQRKHSAKYRFLSTEINLL